MSRLTREITMERLRAAVGIRAAVGNKGHVGSRGHVGISGRHRPARVKGAPGGRRGHTPPVGREPPDGWAKPSRVGYPAGDARAPFWRVVRLNSFFSGLFKFFHQGKRRLQNGSAG